jgi:drug/metabolite transporter (DMT)-like permease
MTTAQGAVPGRPGSAHAPGGAGRPGIPGVLVAATTALISGVAVFVNSYGVHSYSSPAVYTTAKNLVATVVLVGCILVARSVRRRRPMSAAGRFVSVDPERSVRRREGGGFRDLGARQWIGLAYVGVVGGGLAFVLFFDGLADTTATPAAFWKDTLVIWVAVLAVTFLHERVTWLNVGAIALLVVGEVAVSGGTGHLGASRGELLVLSASILWAVEVVLAKVLLRSVAPGTISVVRMGVGAVALVTYLVATGSVHSLFALDATQVGWALLTGLLLAGYVGTWMTALARARAIDVTSILVASAVVTALLQAAAGAAALSSEALGLALIALGGGLVIWAGIRRPELEQAEAPTR